MQINCITHRLLDVLTLVLLASRAGSVAFVTYITDMLRLWVGRSRMPNNDQQKVPPTTLPAGHGFYKSNWCLVSNDGHGKCWIPRKSAFAGKLGATTVKVLAKKRTSPINRTRNVSKYGNNDIITMDVSPRYWQFFGRRTGGPVGEACSRKSTFRPDRGFVFLSGLCQASSKFRRFLTF